MKKFLRKAIAILTTITILTFAGAPTFATDPTATDSLLSQESLEFLLKHDVDVSVFEKGSPALDKHPQIPNYFDNSILSLIPESEANNFSSKQIQQYVKGLIDVPTTVVRWNDKQLDFDVEPRIENGRALVPLRTIFEAMEANVKWDEETQTVTATREETVVLLKIGSLTPSIDGQIKSLDVPAKIIKGRTLAPLRFVGEAFGEKVEWDSDSQTINISANTKEEVVVDEDSSLYPEYSTEELNKNSDLIIEGKFKGYSEEFRVKPINGGDPGVFKDAKIEVNKVFKGDVKKGEIISIRIMEDQHLNDEGDIIYSTVSQEKVEFEKDENILLFSYKPTSDIYRTNENYYKLLGASQSVFIKEDGKYSNIKESEKIISISELSNLYSHMGSKDREKIKMLENLKNKQITQVEYDEWLSSRDKYAERLE